jgi:hypothetical protein
MDFKYAFTTIHVHGALYKERGLINLGGKSVKYGQEILELLEAVWAPKALVLRAPEGETAAVQGNWKADRETK